MTRPLTEKEIPSACQSLESRKNQMATYPSWRQKVLPEPLTTLLKTTGILLHVHDSSDKQGCSPIPRPPRVLIFKLFSSAVPLDAIHLFSFNKHSRSIALLDSGLEIVAHETHSSCPWGPSYSMAAVMVGVIK